MLRFFRIHIPKVDSFPMLFSHPSRPPGRPPASPPVRPSVRLSVCLGSKLNQNGFSAGISMFKTESKSLELQYFHVQN